MPTNNWMDRGRCKGTDPEIFFEDASETLAKAICRGCPVKPDCLTWAMDNDQDGVWGGMSSDERRKLQRVVKRVHCLGCGSNQTYSDGRSRICVGCGTSWLESI